jgi:hypothetical protein
MIQREFTGKAFLPGLGTIPTGKVYTYPMGELAGTIDEGMILHVEKPFDILASEVTPIGEDENAGKLTAPQWYKIRVEVENVRDAVEFDAYLTDEDIGPISLQELYIASTVGGNPGPRVVFVGDSINRLTFGATALTPDGWGLLYNAETGLLELREITAGGGGGIGDMLAADYDPNGNGNKVALAEHADTSTLATTATNATNAVNATNSQNAVNAEHADEADSATAANTALTSLHILWTAIEGRPVNATEFVAGLMSELDKAKLNGIAAGATANSTDAFLRARANHTGTQLAATVSDLSTAIETAVKALLTAGANVTIDETTPGVITISANVTLPGNVVVTDGATQTITKSVELNGGANNLYKIVLPSTTGTKGFQITAPDGVTEVLSFAWNTALGGYPTITLGASPSYQGLTINSRQVWTGEVEQSNGPNIGNPTYSYLGIKANLADLWLRPGFANGGSLALGAYISGVIPAITAAYSYFAGSIPFSIVGSPSGTADLFRILKNPSSPGDATGATVALAVSKDGALQFGGQIAEVDAPNLSIFVSSTGGNAGKIVFKNAAGVVTAL